MVQNWEDLPMVDPPEPGRLRLPRSALRGEAPVRYVAYTGKAKCDDCMELYSDHYNHGEPLPGPARQARAERKQAGNSKLLCVEHKHLRQELETRR